MVRGAQKLDAISDACVGVDDAFAAKLVVLSARIREAAATGAFDSQMPVGATIADNETVEEVKLEEPVYGRETALKADFVPHSVTDILQRAYALAVLSDMVVITHINGHDVPVFGRDETGEEAIEPREAVDRARNFLRAALEREDAEWLASPAGIAYEAESEAKLAAKRTRVAELIEDLPGVIAEGQDALVAWVGEFAAINDDSRIEFDAAAIAEKLEATGLGSFDFDSTPKGVNLFETNGGLDPSEHQTRLAQVIITKAVGCLHGPCQKMHPMLRSDAVRYTELFVCDEGECHTGGDDVRPPAEPPVPPRDPPSEMVDPE